MNIFYLDDNLEKCAQYHCDTHVVKMILESTQILCTVLHETGINAPYRPTHKKHPCVIWTLESLDNWIWLKNLTTELNKEHQYRFKPERPHQSFLVSQSLASPSLRSEGITHRPLIMPDKYKVLGDPVSSYRRFYASEKRHLLKYTRRKKPYWLSEFNYAERLKN